MSEYSWPAWGNYADRETIARSGWEATVQALPVGTQITGEVIGRQPFGVFLRIDGTPDAIGLAEITTMPRCADLPHVGEQVSGEVIWHADHNHQVKIQLTEWTHHEDLLLQFADRIGQIAAGHVTKLAPIGAFVRLAHCVVGLVPLAELSDEPIEDPAQAVREGKEISVRIRDVDLERRRITLSVGEAPFNPAVTSAPPTTPAQRSRPTTTRAADRSCAVRPGHDDAQPPRRGPRR